MFKSLLFLGATIIINEYGLRRVTEIKGIGRAHPIFTACMVIGILSITGAPLFVGVLSKSLIKYSMGTQFEVILFQIVNLGTILIFVKFSKLFFGKPSRKRKIKKEQMAGMLILAGMCIVSFLIELKFIPTFLSINQELVSDNLGEAISKAEYLAYSPEYLLEYLIMLLTAYIIYKITIKPNSKILYRLRHFRLKFQDAIVSLILFLVIVIKVID